MKLIASTILAILLALLSTSCVSPPRAFTFELSPIWVAMLFAEEGEAAPLVDSGTRHFLIASAVFIDSRKSAFASLDELNEFLVGRFGAKAVVPISVLDPSASPGQFVLRFRSGDPVVMTVTPTRIRLVVRDAENRDIILQSIAKRSESSSRVPQENSKVKASDFALTAALLNVLR
jgi:hypothetical protein